MVLDKNVEDAGVVGVQIKAVPTLQEKLAGQVGPVGLDKEVEAGADGLEGGLMPDDGVDEAEHVEDPVGEGMPGEVPHEVEEDGLVESADLVGGHQADDRVHRVELLALGELVEERGVGGVVVGEAPLIGDLVEYVERALRVPLALDQGYGRCVGDEPLLGRWRRGWWFRHRVGRWRRVPWERGWRC